MESTKDERVWHEGPPPGIGWWNASKSKDPGLWRWWNGSKWSLGSSFLATAEAAADVAVFKDWNMNYIIQWSDYYPDNARVPEHEARRRTT